MTLRSTLLACVLGLATAIPALGQYRSSSSSSTTTNKNTATATAAKAVGAAQANVNRAQADMTRIKNRLRQQILTKPEWASVVSARKQADAALDTARRALVANLHNREDYKNLERERDQAHTLMSQTDPPPSPVDSQKAQDTYIKNAMAMKVMEKAAEKEDPKYQDALSQVNAANEKMKNLDQEVDVATKSDTEYQNAQKTLEQAQTALDSAKKQLAQANQQERQQREQQMKQQEQQHNYGR